MSGRVSTSQPLQNVIDISIGDDLAIALVDESQEGLGTGTVYTWGPGRNGALGRNIAGTANSGNEVGASNVARPARLISATAGPAGDGFLRNIREIAAGDVAGFALDINGYVWAWGNGGWGGITGQGIAVPHSDPRRVLRGAVTSGAGQDGSYLKARSIAAGLGFAMAVTIDGKPVAWGNNTCASNPPGPATSPSFACGGNLGNNGMGTMSATPVYITNVTGGVHNDVLFVSRGDLWGYYVRSDNTVWVWGDNSLGQLGIGGYTAQNRAVVFNGIANCSRPDPVPTAIVSVTDTTVCASRLASSGIELNSGINLSSSLLPFYEFTWYRVETNSPISIEDTASGNVVKKGSGLSFSTYNVTLPGRYWVKVKYIGSRVTCGGHSQAVDYSSIFVHPNSFNTKTDLVYCNNEANVSVSSLNPSKNPVYYWYPSSTGLVQLGSSIGSGNTNLNVSGVPANAANEKVIYVEEKYSGTGTVAPGEPSATFNYIPTSMTAGGTTNISGRDMLFQTLSGVRIDTIYLYARTLMNNPETASFQFNVYGVVRECNGRMIANRAAGAIGTGQTYSATLKNPGGIIAIPVNILVNTPGYYYLGLTSNFSGDIKFYSGVSGMTNTEITTNIPKVDNITGEVLKIYGTDDGGCAANGVGTYGSFFNWKVTAPQTFCDRKPVTLKSCIITILAEGETELKDFMIYPNPSSDLFTVESKLPVKISVIDSKGNQVESKTVTGKEQIGENWNNGIYLMKINGQHVNRTIKLSKVR